MPDAARAQQADEKTIAKWSFIDLKSEEKPSQKFLASLTKLLSEDPAKRTQAESEIIDLGPSALPFLPLTTPHWSPEVQKSLTEIRAALEIKSTKEQQGATRISLNGSMDLAELFKKFNEQGGVELTPPNSPVPLSKSEWMLKDIAFWEALDQMLDDLNLSLYSSANNRLLTGPRPLGAESRSRMANYIEGYRINPSAIVKRHSFSEPLLSDLNIDVEFSWEPKNVPALISMPTENLELICDNGEILQSTSDEPLLYFPVGELNTELNLSFDLPTRLAKKISRWNGGFQVATVGALAGVEFDQLELNSKANRKLQSGILNVSLESISKNQDLIECRVGVRMDNDQVQEGWEQIWLDAQRAYIVDAQGKRIEHVGWSTTRFQLNDTGVSFLFELENGLEGCKFVYLAPGAIHTTNHNFEVIDIPLP